MFLGMKVQTADGLLGTVSGSFGKVISNRIFCETTTVSYFSEWIPGTNATLRAHAQNQRSESPDEDQLVQGASSQTQTKVQCRYDVNVVCEIPEGAKC